jgi:aspartyl-tRNA(Asn)/glutamyl-tRNA(Gln) amidotransferase subunit A
MTMELCDHTAAELSALLHAGKISATEITRSVFRRIDERDGGINAYISTCREAAMKAADEADARYANQSPLSAIDGIPVAVKDNICTRGVATTCGSKILTDYMPPYDATAVTRLKQSGAVLVGKTNLDEFGMGSSTEKSAYGPTRNPHDDQYVAGGSSGGSAAAVASGEAILSLGSDTGGSIRMPAAYCGVTGIKPTYGRVSRYGLIAYASSLDQIGGFGRSVADCALLLNTIAGHDPRDTTSADVKTVDYTQSLQQDIRGLKIGMPKEYFVEGLDAELTRRIQTAVELLSKEGAEIVEVSIPNIKYAVSTYYLIATAEASSNLARFDGVKYGLRETGEQNDLMHMYEYTRSYGFGMEVKRRIMLGTYVLSAGYYDAYYLKAQKLRTLIRRDFDDVFNEVDCLIAPVTTSTPFRIGEKSDDPLQMYLEDIYTVSVNLAGLPGMSVNCGTVRDLPVAFQIIGKPFEESTLFRLGNAYEKLASR